jgi:hypothetical protein
VCGIRAVSPTLPYNHMTYLCLVQHYTTIAHQCEMIRGSDVHSPSVSHSANLHFLYMSDGSSSSSIKRAMLVVVASHFINIYYALGFKLPPTSSLSVALKSTPTASHTDLSFPFTVILQIKCPSFTIPAQRQTR